MADLLLRLDSISKRYGATLALDNAAIGSISGGNFQSATLTANKVDFTHIKATYKDQSTEANLTVVWLRMSGQIGRAHV